MIMKIGLGVLGIGVTGLLASVVVGVLLGLGGYTFHYAEGGSYFSNDPKACMNCHIMREQYEGWVKSSHHAVAVCNDCHTPHDLLGKYAAKAENGFWHSKGFTLQDFHEPIQIKPRNARILNANCIACHQDLTCEIVSRKSTDQISCVHCHASVGHGPTR